MERWPTQHHLFCVGKLTQFNSMIIVQRCCRRHFNVSCYPERKTILVWCNEWRQLDPISNKKSTGRPRSASNERNEEMVINTSLCSRTRSAIKHATVLGFSHPSIRKMLRRMNFHPYKIAITQESNDQPKINQLCILSSDSW